MSRQWFVFSCARPVACALVAGILAGWLAPPAAAQPNDALFREHLAAGEFAPALEMARQAATPAQRDAWLAQIAEAQAQAGDRSASWRSAAEMGDDQSRSQTLGRIAARPVGAMGGGAEADFDSLINLITSTVRPTTWDAVGGPGSIAPFPTGVYVDSQGMLRNALREEGSLRLAHLRAARAPKTSLESVRRSSPLRMVSLARLERHVQWRLAAGQTPTEEMQVLAGLQRIRYVLVYPASGDIVLAGPAGDWVTDRENRILDREGGRPVVRLDDLVVVLRAMTSQDDARFGCMITPNQAALSRVQEFVKESNKTSIRPEQRKAWLEKLRAQVGQQDIEVYGLDPRTHAARILVEADYRMKLVGMGLEEGVPGVTSYLNLVQVPPGQAPPPMGVLRWWFTLNYDAVTASPDRQAFELCGQGVKVLSENERLSAEGKRIHTGESDELNRQFARSFTEHFEDLARKYPIYAEMRNVFDLALVAALIRSEGLARQTGWHMTCFGNSGAYQVELGAAPMKVDTVINHRVINRVHIVAGVSGGVSVHPASLVSSSAIAVPNDGTLAVHHNAALPKQPPLDAWWWD